MVKQFKGRVEGFIASNWLVRCSAIGGNGSWLSGCGPTDIQEKLNGMGLIGSTGNNWYGKVRVVRNGQDQGNVTEYKSRCFN